MRAVYVVGEPGVGKSTAMRSVAEGWGPAELRRSPFAHLVYRPEGAGSVIQLGAPHPDYPGTDRLSMSVQPKAVEFVAGAPCTLLVAEGDRLATVGFLEALEAATAGRWVLVYLAAPASVLEARRLARGSDQSPEWLKGRATKVAKLVDRFSDRVIQLDAQAPAVQVAEALAWCCAT